MSDAAVLITPPQPRATKALAIHVTYVPRPGLLSLSIVNFLLVVATLTLYRFWAKTKVRRHIWSCVHINGEPLEYTGTGKELFLGALVVFLIFILPLVILAVGLTLWLGPEHRLIGMVQIAGTALVLILFGMAIYRARRYRLSRTLWRGIRGTLVGSAWKFSLVYFGSLLLKALTLGWSTPAMNLELQQRLVRNMRFGDQAFTFRGRAGPLYPAYAASWFGTIVLALLVLGLLGGAYTLVYLGEWKDLFAKAPAPRGSLEASIFAAFILAGALVYIVYGTVWTIYQAAEMNAFTAYTGFDQARFRLAATVPSLIGLWLGNLAIFVFTLSIGGPFILQRNIRYFCDRLTVDGTVDIDRIRQSSEPLLKRGEGLAEAFDIDGF